VTDHRALAWVRTDSHRRRLRRRGVESSRWPEQVEAVRNIADAAEILDPADMVEMARMDSLTLPRSHPLLAGHFDSKDSLCERAGGDDLNGPVSGDGHGLDVEQAAVVGDDVLGVGFYGGGHDRFILDGNGG
jgi:hypothetical protein